jgi:hypothetical protein
MIVAGTTENGEILKQMKRLSPVLLVGGPLKNAADLSRFEKNNHGKCAAYQSRQKLPDTACF